MNVTASREGDAMIITMNRPEANNTLTASVMREVLEAFRVAAATDAKVIVTRAEGKNFCVGADAGELLGGLDGSLEDIFRATYEGKQGLPSLGGPTAQALDDLGFNRWAWEISKITVPSIAMISGAVAGGGLALALLHHFRVADEGAKFTTGFGRLALAPELGCSFLLPDVIGRQKALDMMVTSRLVRAEEALQIGLIDRLAEPGRRQQTVDDFAAAICELPVSSGRAAVDAVMSTRRSGLRLALEREWNRQRAVWGNRDFRASMEKILGGRVKPS